MVHILQDPGLDVLSCDSISGAQLLTSALEIHAEQAESDAKIPIRYPDSGLANLFRKGTHVLYVQAGSLDQ